MNDKSCGATLEEHLASVITGLAMAGVGTACPESVQALFEVAELFRLVGKHEPYIPVRAPKLAISLAASSQRPGGISVGDVLKLIGQHPDQIAHEAAENDLLTSNILPFSKKVH